MTVNWTTSTGTLNSSSSVTGSDGRAQIIWTFTIAPTVPVGAIAARLTGSVAGSVNSQLSATASVPADHGNPVPVKTGNGDNQSGVVGTMLPHPLSILVVDQHGNPIANQMVAWTTPAGSLSMTATPGATPTDTLTTITASDGTTQAYLTLGSIAGPNDVKASMSSGLVGEPASNRFSLTFTETALP